MRIRFSSQPGSRVDDLIGTQVVVTKHAGKIAAGIFILVFLIFSGVGFVLSTFGGKAAALMAQGAVQVVARVEALDVERRTSNSTSNNRTTYSYYANVAFTDTAGREQRARLSVGQTDYNSLQQGQDLPLRYAAADPSVVELHEGDLANGAQIGYWIMVAGLVGAGVTLAIAAFAMRRRPTVL